MIKSTRKSKEPQLLISQGSISLIIFYKRLIDIKYPQNLDYYSKPKIDLAALLPW